MAQDGASTDTQKGKQAQAQPELDPEHHLSDYLQQLQAALQPLTRNASLLPNHGDLAFHRSIDRKLSAKLDAEADNILASISHLAHWISCHPQAIKPAAVDRSSKGKLKYRQQDLTPDGFHRSLGDLVDHLLENADICLDEFTGKIAPRRPNKNNKPAAAAAATTLPADHDPSKPLPKLGPLPARILNAPMRPPQRKFTTKPDNRPGVPWRRPLKLGKPHAQVPLGHKPDPDHADQPSSSVSQSQIKRGMYCAEGDPRDNPYHYEIMHAEAPAFCFEQPNPFAPPPIDPEAPDASTADIPFVWVDTAEKLRAMADHLKEDRVKEIAIDLEHHSYRTYQGIVCLMQLSTRWGDWIVDTVSDEIRENSEILNESFADPSKVKVLHGANHDVLWLQRDLGLYLVNLFDTYHATNILLFPAHGLNYLMARYCDFDADKRFQLADWRIRPLPKEMLYYARNDTHSLIYIFDSLRQELMQQGGAKAIKDVFELSKQVATAVYAKEEWDEVGEGREGWRTLWRKWGHSAAIDTEKRVKVEHMHKEERLVRRLHLWRDTVAREEDESPRYILGNGTLMMIASRAPTTAAGVLNCISTNAVTALRKRSNELAEVVRNEVDAWEADSKRREQVQKDALATAVSGADDLGESISRQPAAAAPPAQGVNVSLWQSKPATTNGTTAPTTSLFGGPVRTLTSALFGPRAPAPAPAAAAAAAAGGGTKAPKMSNGLFANVSKLFGPRAGESGRASLSAKVEELKKQFASEVEGVLRNSGTLAPAPAHVLEERLAEPEHVPFVPAAERSTAAAAPDSENSSDDDQIVHVSKSKRKHSSSTSAAAAAAAPKKPRTQDTFDFTNSASVLDSPAPATAQAKKTKSKTKPKPKTKSSTSTSAAAQPKKRNEIKRAAKSGTFAR